MASVKPNKANSDITNRSNFQAVYSSLNPAQKTAVDTIDGPVMVIAGPGTGKTQVLTARIAQILKQTDTNPSSILALTFTESAAKNMRERLVQMIGKTGYYVQIGTFHAFCSEVIREHPEYFPIERDSEPLSDLERFELFESIFDSLKLKAIKPLNTPYFYLKDAISSISNLKREGVSTEAYQEMLEQWEQELAGNQAELKKTALQKEQTQLQRNMELAKVYEVYQQRLRTEKRFDFDDMISLVVEAFQTHELLLREYQEELHYFLVDEYQDTNAAQNTIVDLLASFWEEKANIFVVGDPNQAIYRFQGASVENMLGFVKKYSTAKVITLNIGYRCPQLIYDTASDLIAQNQLRLEADGVSLDLDPLLKSVSSQGEPITIKTASSQILEAGSIAEEVAQLIKNGTPAHDIAVLYRHNADRTILAETFDSWSLPYEVEGGGDALKEEIIRQLLTLFRVIYSIRDATENELFYEIMHYPWLVEAFKLDSLVVMKLARKAGRTKQTIWDLIDQSTAESNQAETKNTLESIELKDLAPLKNLKTKLIAWSGLDASEPFHAWFETVINEAGFLPWLLKQETKVFLITVLNSVFAEIKKMISHQHQLKLTDFLRAIKLIEEHKLRITIDDLNISQKAVHFSTVHKAKGREWSHVFLFQCIDKKWGNNRTKELIKLPAEILQNTNLDTKEKNEDERRLFYVALTRAKHSIHISHPATVINESYSRDTVPSMFLAELAEADSDGQRLIHLAESLTPEEAEAHLIKLLSPAKSRISSQTENLYLSHLLKNFRWSVTALNSYLRDPEDFLHYTLLKVPKAKDPRASFGTAVHAVMEHYHQTFQQTGKIPSLEEFLGQFEQALSREVLSPAEFSKRLEHGQQVLKQYYAEYSSETLQPLFVERFFGSGKQKVMLGDIALTGRIDRIDWLDPEKKTVKVVDYKTGRTRSDNEIEGATASMKLSEKERALPESIRGPYKRQLLFYKLLTKLDKSFPYTVEEGMFDFIEPGPSGKLLQRSFMLKDEDVQELEQLIKDVVVELKEKWA